MAGNKMLFFASWVILLIVFAAVAFLSLNSLATAYRGAPDNLVGGFTLEDLREAANSAGQRADMPDLGEAAVNAFRGRRATAATWALACALLALIVIFVPYRRGERWAWWALLISIGLPQLLSLARVLMLHTTFGTGTPAIILAFTLLGLLAGAPRMFLKSDDVLKDE